ncbi:MAG: uroporphyrinogen-III C-methyltransferase [Pseudomonadota bacterium]
MTTGKVYLIGAGPGDPGLITLKAITCLKKADVVIYDFLASRRLLIHAPKGVEAIYVGKKGGGHAVSQSDINDILVAKAKAGLTVARLKGGDPFIFGRGGEEAEILVAEGIKFEIIPGISSAISGPAYAGIPVTHRRYTATVAIITGHEDPSKEDSKIEWEKIATGAGTLVFLMGMKNIFQITEKLILHGRSHETPAAIIMWATTGKQTTITGTLGNIAQLSQDAGCKPPAVIVIGEVVRLRNILNWFEMKPLFGKTIVVTRARDQASGLLERLEDLGAECLEVPTIQVAPISDWSSIDQTLGMLETFNWVVFSSANGVEFFFNRLYQTGRDARALHKAKICAVGPATAESLKMHGLQAELIPDDYKAEGLLEALAGVAVKEDRVLIVRPEQARTVLQEGLRRKGVFVEEACIYKTIPATPDMEYLKERLREKSIDLITFTSSSTVNNFNQLFSKEERECLLSRVHVACIGPVTRDTAHEFKMQVTLVPEQYTIDSLCEAIVQCYGRKDTTNSMDS